MAVSVSIDLSNVVDLLAENGLILRGGFDFDDGEDRPAGISGRPAKAVFLVGNAGADYWAQFSRWRAAQPPGLPNPLDSWSRMVLETIAETVGARVVMPNDRPFAPFQKWAMRADALTASPLGLLIHPRYGLWHAFRGALLFEVEVSIQRPVTQNHPCDLCVGKPCLNACPVGAFSPQGFAYDRCVAHVRSEAGGRCRSSGCLARNACPVGTPYRYPSEVQLFHQKAFAGF